MSGVSLSIPQTQNTAPVLEYSCLWTQDVNRKGQKRWQDGRLKFHTFNKRIMVYDERSYAVGNAHWQNDWEFSEGEELRVDRIDVQVLECTGKSNQDLTELVDKRVKEKEGRAAAKAAASATPIRNKVLLPGDLMRPKPLNAVIGTPTGHYGRALVTNVSPFEVKNQAPCQDTLDRSAKRQKTTHLAQKPGGYAQSLTGATLSLGGSQRVAGTASIRYEPFKSSLRRTGVETIDLTSDTEQDGTLVQGDIERTVLKPSPVISQGQKHYKSPPRRSKYASNLVGASLNLAAPARREIIASTKKQDQAPPNEHVRTNFHSRVSQGSKDFIDSEVEPFAMKEVVIPSGLNEVALRKNDTEKGASKSAPFRKSKDCAPTSSTDLMRTKVLGIPVHKPIAMPKTKPSLEKEVMAHAQPGQTSRSLSLVTQNDVQNTAFDLAATGDLEASSNKATSTLRIKPRPPRQMMMLMGRPPTSSSSASIDTSRKDPETTGFSGHTQEMTSLNLGSNSQGGHASNASNPTNVFFNSRRPSIHLEDLSSPLEDDGINHQMIDALLTRKSIDPGIVAFGTTEKPIIVRPKKTVNSTSTGSSPCLTPIMVSDSATAPSFNVPRHETADDSNIIVTMPTSKLASLSPIKDAVEDHVSKARREHSRPLEDEPQFPGLTMHTNDTDMPEPKLAVQATRGQNIPSVAKKTIHRITEVGLARKTPTSISRSGIMNNNIGRSKIDSGEVEESGPWTRESFDLFGTWKPPGRENKVTS